MGEIYKFAQAIAPQYLSQRKMIGNGDDQVPDKAYSCTCCGKSFAKLSSMMQHKSSAHGVGDLSIGY